MTDLRYALHGVTIGLVWFGLINVVLAAVVACAAERALRREAERNAAFWLTLRLLPAIAAIAFVIALFAPSYWQYEPRAVEDLDLSLSIGALAAALLIGAAVVRGWRAWQRAATRTRAWLRVARPIATAAGIPVYEVPTAAPMMALAGVFRPRLLVTRGVVDALTGEELQAGIAHEIGHFRARDNLKRLAMRAAPDVLMSTRLAAALEARWASAAEHDADRAGAADNETRCALASALVKVAKLIPVATPIAEPISTLVDGGDIASRVQRLLDDGAPAANSR
ncbi:MAG: M56 family metallopeptidase [Acidobacteria bacterium]|nr:M56 family metallopeptidase [Acidobacteriota bacterium]